MLGREWELNGTAFVARDIGSTLQHRREVDLLFKGGNANQIAAWLAALRNPLLDPTALRSGTNKDIFRALRHYTENSEKHQKRRIKGSVQAGQGNKITSTEIPTSNA